MTHRTYRGRLVAAACIPVLAVAVRGSWLMPVSTSHSARDVSAAPEPRRDSTLWIEMRNIDLHVDATHVMHVRSLRGQVVRTDPATIPWLDQPTSFHIRATSGTVALDGAGITALLTENAFNYPDPPIKDLRVRIESGQVVQSGILHKGVDIAFTMWAVPVLLPDGRIQLSPNRLTILGVNGLSLMHALHLHLDSMMDLSKAHGVSVKGDDLVLDPLAIIPPPTVQGRLSSVRIEGDLLVQEFSRQPDDTVFGGFVKPDTAARNFIYFRGGMLRFGRLTMTDTDLQINDEDETDPLDLYFAEYNAQLAAGHTKNLANLGLRTWMVDYAKLPAAAKHPAR